MLERMKSLLKALPKIYWIYVAVLLVAEVVVFAMRPDSPGLYTMNLQWLPLSLSVPFLIFRGIRQNFKRMLYAFALLSFLFLALDYNIGDLAGAGHAGLVQVVLAFCPICLRFGISRI